VDFFLKDTTSKILEVCLRDSSTGAGKTGLAFGDVTASYCREGGTRVAITLASGTAGDAYSSGKWAEVDATNQAGLYQLHIPNAALVTGADAFTITLQAADPISYQKRWPLTDFDVRSVAMARAVAAIGIGTASGTPTTTNIPTSSLVPAASSEDQFVGRIVTFDKDTTTAGVRGHSTDITASTAGGVLTVTALATAPVSGDTFTIQ